MKKSKYREELIAFALRLAEDDYRVAEVRQKLESQRKCFAGGS